MSASESVIAIHEKLMGFIGVGMKAKVLSTLEQCPGIVAIAGGHLGIPYRQAVKTESRWDSMCSKESSPRRLKSLEKAQEILQIVRDATLKYAIDHGDTALLDKMKELGDCFSLEFADGTRPRRYLKEHPNAKVQAWLDVQDSAADATFFKPSSFARVLAESEALEARQLAEDTDDYLHYAEKAQALASYSGKA